MNEYRIIHCMKMHGKAVVVLSKKQAVEDMNKTKVMIDGTTFDYLLTYGDDSIVIETPDDLSGKILHFV